MGYIGRNLPRPRGLQDVPTKRFP
ncbi:uncharacterized protein G2W53_021357 [Senna tora]|uniref:Uncharacterized protein n=1 Tax=Senna tora TaxID=362788 RepID=A0A834TJC8_9FABA|nr:uncharacterized protein G2W53_021357 [Senna tora]